MTRLILGYVIFLVLSLFLLLTKPNWLPDWCNWPLFVPLAVSLGFNVHQYEKKQHENTRVDSACSTLSLLVESMGMWIERTKRKREDVTEADLNFSLYSEFATDVVYQISQLRGLAIDAKNTLKATNQAKA